MKQNKPQSSPFEEAMKQIAKAPKKEVAKAIEAAKKEKASKPKQKK